MFDNTKNTGDQINYGNDMVSLLQKALIKLGAKKPAAPVINTHSLFI